MSKINSKFGACTVSKNIYEGKGNLKWCIKEESKREADNGWVFLSDIDTEEYLSNFNNFCILSFETLIEIEPAILSIYDMKIGTELTLLQEGDKKFFINTNTGVPLSF